MASLIDSKQIRGVVTASIIEGDLVVSSGSVDFTNTTGVTGSFSGSFVGDGTGLILPTGILSSSEQISVEISSAFDADSASFDQRISQISSEVIAGTPLGTISSSAQLNNTTLDGLNLTNTSSTGSFSGSFYGDGSNLTGVTSYTDTDTQNYLNSIGIISGANQLAGEIISGDLTVSGILTAQEFHTEYVSASIIFTSGSTQFGNSNDDTHIFSGSLTVSNIISASTFRGDGSQLTGISTDNFYPETLNFNNGVLQLSGSGMGIISSSLDGRYLISSSLSSIIESYTQSILDDYGIITSTSVDASQRILGDLEIYGNLYAYCIIYSQSIDVSQVITGSTSFGEDSSSIHTFIGNVNVTGGVTADSFSGDGSNITGIISASYAETASYALNAGSGVGFPFSGSADITGSLSVSDQITTTIISASVFCGDGSNLIGVSGDNFYPESLDFDTGSGNLELSGSGMGVISTSLDGRYSTKEEVSNSIQILSQSIGDSYISNTGISYISGNLVVSGAIIAEEFQTNFVSASIIYSSGSTKFGDDINDSHQFTGSLFISGNVSASSFSGDGSNITGIISASYSETASYALNAGSGAGFPFSGSAIITGSLLVSDEISASVFCGDGSNLDGIVSSQSFSNYQNSIISIYNCGDNTGSFTGHIIPTAHNTYNLGSPTKQWKDVYIGPGSLYIAGAKVISSENKDLCITTDSDQNIQIIETGIDTISLKTEDGDIILSSDSGSVEVCTCMELRDAVCIYTRLTLADENSYINSATANPIRLANNTIIGGDLIVSGNITLEGTETVDGVDLSVCLTDIGNCLSGLTTTASFQTYTGSTDSRLNSLESFTSSYTESVFGIVNAATESILQNYCLVSGSSQICYSELSGLSAGIISSSNQLAGETISGDLTVGGRLTAREFHTEFVSASVIFQSGSTQFGNSADDTHIFTGNIKGKNDLMISGGVVIGCEYYSCNPIASGMLVQGQVSIGTACPSSCCKLEVDGGICVIGNVDADSFVGSANLTGGTLTCVTMSEITICGDSNRFTGNVLISPTSQSVNHRLQVEGSVSASNFYGDGSGLTGITATTTLDIDSYCSTTPAPNDTIPILNADDSSICKISVSSLQAYMQDCLTFGSGSEGGSGTGFPYIGDAELTGSLIISSSAPIDSTIFSVYGSEGKLFGVDNISDGNLFAVYEPATQTSIFEVSSSGDVNVSGDLNITGNGIISGDLCVGGTRVNITNTALRESTGTIAGRTLQQISFEENISQTNDVRISLSEIELISGSVCRFLRVEGDNGVLLYEDVDGNDAPVDLSGSFCGTFFGDGSNLAGLAGIGFPYSGSALITGSLFISASNSDRDYLLTVCGGDSLINGVVVGRGGCYTSTDGLYNTVIGKNALIQNGSGSVTVGDCNTAVGAFTLDANIDGFQNTAVGVSSLTNNTSGCGNTGIGFNSLFQNSTGSHNIGIGDYSLYYNTTGNYNIGIGFNSGHASSCNLDNIITIGCCARATDSNQIVIGNTNSTTARFNNYRFNIDQIIIGKDKHILVYNEANDEFELAEYDVSINGITLGRGNGNVTTNTTFGFNGLCSNTTGCCNTGFGYATLCSNTIGSCNTGFGICALSKNTTGYINTAVGVSALGANISGCFNTATGYSSLCQNTIGNGNTAYGFASLYYNTTGTYNTAIGYHAGLDPSCVYHNTIAIGCCARVTQSNQAVIGNQNTTKLTANNYTFNIDQLTNGKDGYVLAYNETTDEIELSNVSSGSYSGSFYGVFYGDGSNLTGVTSYTDDDNLDLLNELGVLSGSVQDGLILTNTSVSGTFSGSFWGDGSNLENVTVYSATSIRAQFQNVTSTIVNHNFNSLNILTSVYDDSNKYFIPAEIEILDFNTIKVTFDTLKSGYVVVARGGHIISGSIEWDSVLEKPSDIFYKSTDTTSGITEGSNLFYRNDRVKTYMNLQNVISGSSQLNNTTVDGITLTNTSSTGSFSGSFYGNGSGLTDLIPFPYIGDAEVSGSLFISSSTSNHIYGNLGINTTTPRTAVDIIGSDILIQDMTVGLGASGSITNTAVGYCALSQNYPNPGITAANVAVGYCALGSNQLGYSNIAVGYFAANQSDNSADSIAIGTCALYQNSASHNIAVGTNAMASNTDGYYNTAFGRESLLQNSTGLFNVGVGPFSLYHNTTGCCNVGIGFNAGNRLGYPTLNNNLVIGSYNSTNNAILPTTSNQIVIGNTSHTQARFNNYKFNIDQSLSGLDKYSLSYNETSGQIELSNDLTGSFSGIFYGDGSNLQFGGTGILSSSAQIDSQISGAFDELSQSFDTRLDNLEEFSTSLDATFATDSELQDVSSSLNQSIDTLTSVLLTQVSGLETDISILSESVDIRLDILESFSTSLDATFATDSELSVVSESLVDSINTKLNSASFNQFTESYLAVSNSFDNRLDEIETTFSTSVDIRLDDLESFSTSLDATFATDSELSVVSESLVDLIDTKLNSESFELFTESFYSISSSFGVRLEDLESFSTSLDNTFATDESVSILSTSLDIRLDILESFSTSLDATFATDSELNSVSESLVNLIDTKLNSASFNQFTQSYLTDSQSLLDSIDTKLNSSSFEAFTQSYLSASSSIDVRLDNLEDFSTSLDTIFATDDELEAVSSSLIDAINTKLDSASFNTFSQSYISESVIIETRFSDLESFSSSLNTTFATDLELGLATQSVLNDYGLISSSVQISEEISGAFNQISSSFDIRLDNLESFSTSLDTTFATDSELNSVSESLLNLIDTKLETGSFISISASLDGRVQDLEDFSSSLNTIYATEVELNEAALSILNDYGIISSSAQLAGSTISGDLTISGIITAQEFHTEYVSASIIYESGSTQFGDTGDDIHTFSGSILVSNTIKIGESLQTYYQNNTVSGSDILIASASKLDYDGLFFDYVIKSGSNLRAGTVTAVHNGSSTEYFDNSTQDMGNTSDVILRVDISGDYIRLLADTDNSTWNVKTFVKGL